MRKFLLALITGAALILGGLGIASPAQASAQDTSWCNGTGWICLSSSTNGNGNKVHFTTTGINGGYSLSAAGNVLDQDGEWVSNRSAWAVTIYVGTNCDANTGTGSSNVLIVPANTGRNIPAPIANHTRSISSAANYFGGDVPCANTQA